MLLQKIIRSIFLISFISLGFLVGCDIIEPPYVTEFESPNGDHGEVVQKVLLEEFTGHQCPNCPEGSAIAAEIKDWYGDRVVIMSIHAGWFARVSDGMFSYDFQTEEGNALNNFFGVNQNPIGMVNRTPFNANPLMGPYAWWDAVAQAIEQEPAFGLELELSFDAGSANLTAGIDVHTLMQSSCQYRLSVFLTESGIIKPQRTNNPDFPSGVIEDYEHKYVLRTSFNGTWGEMVNESSIKVGDNFTFGYTITLDQDWVPENCSVVAFIYHATTMEVIQVEEKPVTP